MAIRKAHSAMSPSEIAGFVNALKALKTTPVNGRGYDWYVDVHIQYFGAVNGVRYAHRSPSFLTWHREYLRLLEFDLQTVSGNSGMFLPYWNWGVRGEDAALFTGAFMGPAVNGNVLTGPFTPFDGWSVHRSSFASSYLQRRINPAASRPTDLTIQNVEDTYVKYDNPTYDGAASNSYRRQAESRLHDRIHVWVGGNMGSADSPNDPLFFLHHCNVDRIWSLWQRRYGTNLYRPTTSYPGVVALNETMQPFGQSPASVLSIGDLGYDYA